MWPFLKATNLKTTKDEEAGRNNDNEMKRSTKAVNFFFMCKKCGRRLEIFSENCTFIKKNLCKSFMFIKAQFSKYKAGYFK